MYQQVLDPVGGSLAWSALIAALPPLLLFVLLGVFKVAARWAALAALLTAAVIAIGVYGMPTGQVLSGALEGAAVGFFPIIWVGIAAIWLYNLTVASGHFVVLRRSFNRISGDPCVQAIVVAFCFGGLLEALAGGGSPVAICTVMLLTLGFDPVKAAAMCLLADTSPVAFGALGQPITVLSQITGLPAGDVAATVGRQTPVLAFVVPFLLVGIAGGRPGLRRNWPLALIAGGAFALTQSVAASTTPPQIVDIIAALVTLLCVLGLVRLRARAQAGGRAVTEARIPPATAAMSGPAVSGGLPGEAPRSTGPLAGPPQHLPSSSGPDGPRRQPATAESSDTAGPDVPQPVDSVLDRVRAFAPYVIVIAVVAVSQIPAVTGLLERLSTDFAWPALHIRDSAGKPLSTTASFEWLSSAGTLALIAGLVTTPVLGLGFGPALRVMGRTLHQLRWAILTVCAVVGLAYVMNLSGQTITLGVWLAGAGALFPLISPLIGWVGTAITGSDTSTNTLFGVLQVTTAHHAGLSDVLLASANTSGGVMGKAISPQNLSIAAVAVNMSGREGVLFRRVVGWTALLVIILALLVFGQSTSVLSWTLPG